VKFLNRMKIAWGVLRADGNALHPGDDFFYTSRGFETATGIRVSPESALRVAAVFGCVRVVAETIASLPLVIYRRLPNGGKERAVDHPLYPILHGSPNAWQTAFEFLEMMQAHLELRGNAYSTIENGGGRAINALIPLHPDRVVVKRLSNGRLQYQVRNPFGGEMQVYNQEQMLHLRGLSSDGLVGMSTISVGAEVVANALATQEYASRFFENDATPPVAFTHPKSLGADAFNASKRPSTKHTAAPIITSPSSSKRAWTLRPSESATKTHRCSRRGSIRAAIFAPSFECRRTRSAI
jgi:phage portal protein BeeE